MPVVQEWWKKLNANEKMVMYGAGAVVIAFLLGVVGGGFGSGSADLIAAIVVGVIYWLKYSPNKITWPLPVQTLVLVISGIAALFAVLALLSLLSFLAFGFGIFGIAVIVNAIGCGMMAYFAWKEYQAMPKTAPPSTPTAPPAPPAPPAA